MQKPEERHAAWLTVETLLVGAVTLVTIGRLNTRRFADLGWFLIPCVLVIAAWVPAWCRRTDIPRLGLDRRHMACSLETLGQTCIYALPAILLALWVMTRLQLPIPLKPVIAGQYHWLTWLVYQFLYVAVAEEVFFRGYIQTNVMGIMRRAQYGSRHTQQFAGMLISAGCFALAHVIAQGRATSLLTFVPGLLLAWLFVRTRALLAPILFHGLANVAYGILALTLA